MWLRLLWQRIEKKRGADRVVGVDISEKMIAFARAESQEAGDDIEFHVQDAGQIGIIGQFDIVTALFLFNYAETVQELQAMFKAAAQNLKKGGKLIAYTVHPDFALEKSVWTKYGVTVLSEEEAGDKYKLRITHSTPAFAFTCFKRPRKVYEEAAKAAGFLDLRWETSIVFDEFIDHYPQGFWDIYRNNCLYYEFGLQNLEFAF